MPHADLGLHVRQPVSAWNRPLQADAKGLFLALGKGIAHAATGQWAALGPDSIDGLSALGLTKDPGEIAWLLIRRSLLAAMVTLAKEQQPLAAEAPKAVLAACSDRLDEEIGKTEVVVDRSFFDRPALFPLLGDLAGPFAEWLVAYGLTTAAARSVAARLPSYFVLALHEEWQRHGSQYELLVANVQTPFTAAAERERAWARNAARLERQLDEPVFGEPFGLRQIYVPLRGYYVEGERRREPADLHQAGGDGSPLRRIAVELEKEFDSWIASGDRTDCLRILSGGPGSGKSSFAKVFAARSASGGRRVLYIPLHQFNVSGSLAAALGEYLQLTEILPANPLDPATKEVELVLLFDGLDELSEQGKLAAESARDFVREVQKVVEIRNASERRLLVLITGREPVVQANTSELRNLRQIMQVLPYHVSTQDRAEDRWAAGRDLLVVDQRDEWWRKYAIVAEKDYQQLPPELARNDLMEITAQPLLNYLVALSFGRGRLDFRGEINLNSVYEDLLEAVYGRAYDKPHPAIRGMQLAEFTRVLEEIALAAWHGNGRTTTLEEIEAHCKAAGLSGLLERFSEGAKAGVSRMLTAFYFRQFGQLPTGERTFEFTHKSFREYLTALRIVRAMRRIAEEIERRDRDFDAGWDDRRALQHWAETCGPEPMDLDLFRFVERECAKRPAEAASWQKILRRLIAFMLTYGMPMEQLVPRPHYAIELRQARNSEEALLAMLNACARTTQMISKIDWPGSEAEATGRGNVSAGTWITRLRGQRSGPSNRLALECLSFLDLSGCILDMIDLYRANLASSDLSDATLFSSCLVQADLTNANLRGAYLSSANLSEAHLPGAYLGGAILDSAILTGAHLESANLKSAFLVYADLKRASLEGANLEGVNLDSANLEGADLTRAKLNDANVADANLKRVIGAKLKGARLADVRPSSSSGG
jgi:uncharacterized protein YjbI with pentapeptide repeats